MDPYSKAYSALNPEQKRAVDTIDGPVMVVAGPGTGKTQVLALRIAHILTKTDTPPDGVLCLTFTNAGVKAMRERLLRYIGPAAMRVRVATFHSFGTSLLEKYYPNLGLASAPVLLDDAASVALLDEIFYAKEWEYLRPRANPELYFRDLKSLMSLLSRERITPEAFKQTVLEDIARLEQDPNSISSRGETKGQLKKDVEKKIDGLKRSIEVAEFYEHYEDIKIQRNVIDYNDVLELMVELVEESDEVRDHLREQFLYVLVDEHQDSSGVQNDFLKAVWQDVEQPNIFVVGDDRQLIYGFGGASLAYFEGFKDAFGKATLITLTSNYRSTQTILDAAEELLQSSLAEGKLVGNTAESHPIRLVEAEYPRDEIIAAAKEIKEKIESGMSADDCAILVPKNRQIKVATQILADMGIPVAAYTTLKLFECPETHTLLSVFRMIVNPHDAVTGNRLVLDPLTRIPTLVAHRFLHESDTRALSLDILLQSKESAIKEWGKQLHAWLETSQHTDVYGLIQIIGSELLLSHATNDQTLRRRVEIVRTFLNLVLSLVEKEETVTLENFLSFIDRLQRYGEDIPLAIFAADRGVRVLTLHGSKGLEFDFVWIAHMDERSLMGSRRAAFTLPESILEKIEERDEAVAKRQLYVAITRAKRFCSISYARYSHAGADQQLASIVAALPEAIFERQSATATEERLIDGDISSFVSRAPQRDEDTLLQLTETVAAQYTERSVSVTLLNNFFECPWKWYFRNLLQLPEPQNDSLHIGNVTHKSIEFVLKHPHAPSPEELRDYIESCALIEARYDNAVSARLAHQVEKIMKTWISTYADTLCKPYEIERSLSYRDPSIPELQLYGKIDIVEELSPGNVRVTDWKTGSAKSKADIDRTDEEGRMSGYLRQLTMYAYLIEGATNGAIAADEARLVFIEAGDDKNAIVSRRITSDDIMRLRNDIKDYRQQIESGEWVKRPCNAKMYGSEDVCEYCALASRYTAK